MNELGNTPADKNYKPSGISRAEERALEAYPNLDPPTFFDETYPRILFTRNTERHAYVEGYEQAGKDILAIVKKYLEKGLRCIEQSDESQIHAFWDGFHNCAENILRELEEEK